jgi:hypothetical protein
VAGGLFVRERRSPFSCSAARRRLHPTADSNLGECAAGFSADVDVRDGQKVVLGKLGSVSGKDAMLVLTARVVD